jgi:HEAT repeat protein
MNSNKCKVFSLTVATILSLFTCVVAVAGEDDLIAVLKSDADWFQKQAACRELKQIGTEKSIDTLAGLLNEEELAHWGRYALESMPYPEVDAAFRKALDNTKGLNKVGVIISIGVRRDSEAVSGLLPLLKDPDKQIAGAAAGALGRIASDKAIKALLDYRRSAPKSLRGALGEGLLAAGQQLVEDNKSGMAVAIYQDLLVGDWPEHIQAGAFYGLSYADPKQAPDRLIKALKGNDPLYRGMAAQIIAETSGTKDTKLYSNALSDLPIEGQIALIRGLAGRKDLAARPAIAKAVKSSNKQIKIAAVQSLSVIGSSDDVPILVELLASSDGDISLSAQDSLSKIEAAGVNSAIVAGIGNVSSDVKVQLLELLANRSAKQAVPSAVKSLNDPDAKVRIAALKLLSVLGDDKHVPAVIETLEKSADTSQRAASENALSAICSRQGEKVLPEILAGMKGADVESRIVLLRSLSRIGGAKAIKTVLKARDDSNSQIREEAVRVLSNWPTMEAAPHLLKLAKSKNLTQQVLGLRGYVRLAQTVAADRNVKTEMLNTVMPLAKRPEEIKLVLAAWGTVPTVEALNVLVPYLDEKGVGNEAAQAIFAVAEVLGNKEKAATVDALNTVIKKNKNQAITKKARSLLARYK